MCSVFLEILLLVTALSADAFAAGFAYGVNKIKIPLSSLFVVTALSSALLSLSLLLGELAFGMLPAALTRTLGFLLLAGLGVWKLFARARGEEAKRADKDQDQLLSPSEALTLGFALSLDSLAAGMGAGAFKSPIPAAFGASFFVGAAAVLAGEYLGVHLAARFRLDSGRLGGCLLILLAILKLL